MVLWLAPWHSHCGVHLVDLMTAEQRQAAVDPGPSRVLTFQNEQSLIV